jgi:hypothetical protein
MDLKGISEQVAGVRTLGLFKSPELCAVANQKNSLKNTLRIQHHIAFYLRKYTMHV